ncbi:MAG TPA: outer membrane beta-barrel protein [Gemmatimonadales bacterium]|nr:outer membrane beta-barrel protein [Gemmatimonadales bacterium]
MSTRRSSLPTLLTGVALLAPFTAAAQQSELEVGFVGGPTWNTMTSVPSATRQGAGHLGAFASFHLGGGFAFRPEISAARKQVRLSTFGGGCPAEVTCLSIAPPTSDQVTFSWLEVPLLVEWRPLAGTVAGFTPKLFGGPFLAVRVGRVSCLRTGPRSQPEATSELPPGYDISSCSGDYEQDGSEPASTGDAGFVLGGVVRRGTIGVGARWTRSLTDAVRPSFPDASRLEGARHSTLSLFIEVVPFFRR